MLTCRRLLKRLYIGLLAATPLRDHKPKRANFSTNKYTRATETVFATSLQARGKKLSFTLICPTRFTLSVRFQTKISGTILVADPGTRLKLQTKTTL